MDTSNMKIHNTIPDNSALTVESGMTVAEVIDFMDQYHRHAVGVTVNDYFAGLFTRSDFIKRVVRCDLNPRKVAVGSVMTLNPIVISSASGIKEAYYLMCHDGYSHLPVVDGDKLVGIISEHDLRKDIASDLRQESRKNKMMESLLREPYGLCEKY